MEKETNDALRNKTSFIRSKNDGISNFYTKVDNDMITDSRLDFVQVGIMTYLLSQSDGYVIFKKQIHTVSKLGRVIFNSAWSGLIELGYLENVRFRRGVRWIIRENVVSENNPNFDSEK